MVLSCRCQVRASAEEAAKLAADTSKMVVETESQGLTLVPLRLKTMFS